MSVEMTPSGVPLRELKRSIREIARTHELDPRLPALVRGFDAPFFQAGLAGYSDAPMRLIARRHGCPFCVTEALLDRTLVNGGKGRTREDPDLLAESCGTGIPEDNRAAGLDDHPIAGQIMGTAPAEMAEGAKILVSFGYEVIDVNLACPVKKVKRRSRGGHFLRQPDEATAVLRAVRDAVPEHIPVTVKMRRAWDDSTEMAERFERLFVSAYDAGCAWVTVHCRTVEQRYVGPGDWTFLRDLVARHPDRLILGSGDIWTADDIFAMIELTGVDAVSVARGCIGNPWIFRQARQLMAGDEPLPPTLTEQRRALLDHFELAVSLHGEVRASRMMRKFGIRFSAHHPEPEEVRREFIKCNDVASWRAVLDSRYEAE